MSLCSKDIDFQRVSTFFWSPLYILHFLIAINYVDDHSLWKATNKFKRPTIAIPLIRKQDGSWSRTNKEKTNLFADYLATVFTPNNKNNIN
jgi:hypothetical protein